MEWAPFLNALASPAWVWALDGSLLDANASALELMGASEPPLGEQWPVLPDCAAFLDRMLKDPGQPLRRTLPVGREDGRDSRVCRFSAIMRDGTPTAILVICEASSATAISSADLCEAQTNLTEATDAAGVATWVLDYTTGIVTTSNTLYAVHGQPPVAGDLHRRHIEEWTHPDDFPATDAEFKKLIAGEIDRLSYEHRAFRADGALIWVKVCAKLRRREELGLAPLVCGCTIDVTERKETELRRGAALQELREAHDALELTRREARETTEMFRFFAANGQIGPFSFCPDTDEGWMMDETYRLMGYKPGEFVPSIKERLKLLHPEDNAGAQVRLKALLAGEASVYDNETRQRHKDGSYHWHRSICRLVDRSDQGLPPMVAGVTTQIDSLKENERRLADALAEAEAARERLDRLAHYAPVGLYEFRIFPDGRSEMPYYNAQLPALLGITAEDIEADPNGAPVRNVFADDKVELAARMRRSKKHLTPYEHECRVNHPERGVIWVLTHGVPVREADGAVVWYGSSIEITERIEMEQRMAETAQAAQAAHARLASIADTVPVGIFETHRSPDGKLALAYSSARFNELTGIEEASPEEKIEALHRNVHPDDLAGLMRAREKAGQQTGVYIHRLRIRHPEHGDRWVSTTVMPRVREDGTVIYNGAYVDITQDVEREDQLLHARNLAEEMRLENERQALHDALTGLPNRRYFDLMLARRFDRLRKALGGESVSLIRIDGDRFKYINDTMGHEAGDAVLQQIAHVLRWASRGADFPARIGGDEFSVLLAPGAKPEAAQALVQRVQEKLAEPLVFDGRRCLIQASFGIASVHSARENGVDLLAFADAALYRAKERGRNRMELFTPDLRDSILGARSLASELQDALSRDEFEPYFQVQIDLERNAIAGAETLLRWRHPTRGVLAPGSFMKVAEQLRIIPDLDRLMVKKAHESLRRLREKGLLVPRVSFNVSSGRMQDPDVVVSAQALIEDGFAVTFELLESTLVEDESDVFRFHLDQLREMGVGVEIDDFGSGHASVIGLMEIAPDALKIDRRLIAPIADDPRAQKLVRAIIEIAETLDIATIAEGVETEAQSVVLRRLGCHVVQGYHYSRPIDEIGFERLLRQAPWRRAPCSA